MIELYVPDSHIKCSLDNFNWSKNPKIESIVKKCLLNETPWGLFLYGDPGIGKTHILVGMFKSFVDKGFSIGLDVMYVQWSALITEINGGLSRGILPELIVDRITGVKVLIIDDVRPSGGRVWNDVLKGIVEKMYDKQGKLIFSANVEGIKDMVSKWNLEDYWISRLKSEVKFVNMMGQDKRKLRRNV